MKGIQTVEDALEAIERGADGLYISNHGGRQLEYSPSPIEVAYEIYRNAPEIFEKVPVLADSGVRTGSDVLKLLALGVKAVGLGRPYVMVSYSSGCAICRADNHLVLCMPTFMVTRESSKQSAFLGTNLFKTAGTWVLGL